MAKEEKVFGKSFVTVKVGEGRGENVKYELHIIDEPAKDGKEEKRKKIGEDAKLMGVKNMAREYVKTHGKDATSFNIRHHKPGRKNDAKEKLIVSAENL